MKDTEAEIRRLTEQLYRMGGYDFSTDAATLATNLETAISTALNSEAMFLSYF